MLHICDCLPTRLQEALNELPESLDKTYERTLQRIKKEKWEFAHRIFQFVSVASRPLHVEELADLLAFDFKAGLIPKFHKNCRMVDPVYAVLSICTTLLGIVNYQGSPVIQFSHFSVKEFLTSTRLAEATGSISRRYHVSMIPAHTLATQACLGILLHLDKDVNRDSLEVFPLAKYAVEHWVDHARIEDMSRGVEDGMKQLSDPSKPHFAICVWIYDLAASIWPRMTRNEKPLPLPHTSLHYAASWGLHPVVEFLTEKHSQDVCSRDSTDNSTPLHLASLNGHMEAAWILIELGADVTARDKDGKTPLRLALQRGQIDVALLLFDSERGTHPTAWNKRGETRLHMVLQCGHIDIARMLIVHGVDVTTQNKDGETLLHLALKSGQVDVVPILLKCGTDPTAQNKDGETPLSLALRSGYGDVARLLVERGTDTTARNKRGETPLHLASHMGQVDVARSLLERGADPTARNNDGATPLHVALQSGQVYVVSIILLEYGADPTTQNIGQVDAACSPLEHGADLTPQNNDGETPLHVALQIGQVDVAPMPLEHSAEPTTQNNDGEITLHLESHIGQVDAPRSPLEHGADLTAQHIDGETPLPPLHPVLQSGQVDVARSLLGHDADLTAQHNDGETPSPPLHLALQTSGKLEKYLTGLADLFPAYSENKPIKNGDHGFKPY